jgi:hypothetical protein
MFKNLKPILAKTAVFCLWRNIALVEGRVKRSVTLIELLIAISLVGFLIIGISTIDNFARFHLMSSNRRSQIQNQTSYLLEHMAKNMIGRETITSGISGDSAVKVYIDYDSNGQRDSNDKQIAYRYRGSGGNYEVWYYSNYTDNPASYVVITNKIIGFSPTYDPSNNYFEMEITACWDPDGAPYACGTSDNPQIAIKTQIKMPAVSAN